MNKYLLILSIVLSILASSCKSKTEKNGVENNKKELSEFVFKVEGLNDSIVADSIWKMIFTIEGIDQLHIKTNDSTIIIKADKSLVQLKTLAKEITSRGGTILN